VTQRAAFIPGNHRQTEVFVGIGWEGGIKAELNVSSLTCTSSPVALVIAPLPLIL